MTCPRCAGDGLHVAVVHDQRRPDSWVEQIEERLGHVHVNLERGKGRWDTHRMALEAGSASGAPTMLMLQDDAVVPERGLRETLEAIGELAGAQPVSLYVGGLRPRELLVRRAVDSTPDGTLLRGPGPWWAVGLLLPTGNLLDLLPIADRAPTPNVDHKLERAYRRSGLHCLYTIPSLVDHRPEAENPSMIRGRAGDRRAHRFVGHDASGLDWTVGGSITRGPTVDTTAKAQVR